MQQRSKTIEEESSNCLSKEYHRFDWNDGKAIYEQMQQHEEKLDMNCDGNAWEMGHGEWIQNGMKSR